MKELFLTFLLCASIHATESELIKQLDDERFEVREYASQELDKCSIDQASSFLQHIQNDDCSPEVKHRLIKAAYNIFYHQKLMNSTEYKKLISHIGFETRNAYEGVEKKDEKGNVTEFKWGYVGVRVDYIYQDGSELQRNDIIVGVIGKKDNGEINEIPFNNWSTDVIVGETYELKIRRYTEESWDTWNENGVIENDIIKGEYKEKIVKIKILERSSLNYNDLKAIERLAKIQWEVFFHEATVAVEQGRLEVKSYE